MINQLVIEELRNTCKCPEKYQLIDIGGVAFGAFFIIDSIRRLKTDADGWARMELVIGSVMALIHSTRFFYGEELK